ncbi:MAG TPA: hypothetical protein VGN90_03170 [Pyrinomonadaceae bacterium]|nr:hypothetical protein [Pyrinomonadaceae bacterium]
MDTQQSNRVTMFKTVAAYLDQNASVWNGTARMATAVAELKDKISTLDNSAGKQDTPTGATDDKAAAREALEDVLFLACEALGILGHEAEDHDLLAVTSLSRSSLLRFDEEQLSQRATQVLAEAKARKTELATLDVTQANIDELESALGKFNAAKARPRAAAANRSAQTQSLPNLLRETTSLLRNRIDRMMSLLQRSQPDFVAGYQTARVIVDRAATHKSTKPAPPSPTPGS